MRYFVYFGGSAKEGPYDVAALIQFVHEGRITSATILESEQTAVKLPASGLPQLGLTRAAPINAPPVGYGGASLTSHSFQPGPLLGTSPLLFKPVDTGSLRLYGYLCMVGGILFAIVPYLGYFITVYGIRCGIVLRSQKDPSAMQLIIGNSVILVVSFVVRFLGYSIFRFNYF